MREDIEVELDSLNEKQLFSLLRLGEIDSITYYECKRELKSKNILVLLFNKIKRIILKRNAQI